jgi:nitrite reductase/ring-hydroxylating ferredoxin subunit
MARASDESPAARAVARGECIGHVSQFPLDEVRLVTVGHTEVGVVRTASGIYGMRNRCPHMGAPICAGDVVGTFEPSAPDEFDYHPERPAVRCPWHRWEWSLETGTAIGKTTKGRLKLYRVEVVDDRVYVR